MLTAVPPGGELALQALGGHPGALAVGVGQEEGELVAAEPVGAVAVPAAPQNLRDALEQRIALGVAMAVVHELEAVEVEQDERDRSLTPLGQRERLRELVLERAVVGEVGQSVAGRTL